jgi:uncharacterized protein
MTTMLLDVGAIREPHLRIERTDEPSALEVEEAYRVVSPVHLAFDLHKDREKVRLVGRLQTVIELACSRCLEDFAIPVDAPFDLMFLPAADQPADEEREIEEDDLGTSFYRDGVIDLRDLVREQLYLALPMKPLCQEPCRGLCPQCGTNLNSGSCSCAPAWEDPRMAPLRALARKQNDA